MFYLYVHVYVRTSWRYYVLEYVPWYGIRVRTRKRVWQYQWYKRVLQIKHYLQNDLKYKHSVHVYVRTYVNVYNLISKSTMVEYVLAMAIEYYHW